MIIDRKILDSEPSPRSTIVSSSELMTTTIQVLNNSNMASALVSESDTDKMLASTKEAPKDGIIASEANPASPSPNSKSMTKKDTRISTGKEDYLPPTPNPYDHGYSHTHGYNVSHTPQAGSYSYTSYSQQHMTPEPPSPANPHGVTDMYNVTSFFPQPGTFGVPQHPSSFGVAVPGTSGAAINMPMSPPRPGMPTMAISGSGGMPPQSPLFPRAVSSDVNTQQRGAPPSPGIPYIFPSQHLGMSSNSVYQEYPVGGAGSRSSEEGTWGGIAESGQQYGFPSPQISQAMYGAVPVSRGSSGSRAYSFDETMIPSVLDQDPSNPAYSPYSAAQTSPGGTVFAHPSWFPGHPDMYNTQGSPLSTRPHNQIPMYPAMPSGGMRPMGPFGQLYAATSPGPPIQTTTSNKGPEGANLFIFHIPNHFTNMDMFQLFCQYGTLLSVRIMVEKDTGRSRGFGFVSYDTAEAAAQAIKALNGYTIGNKRLKVQHKQIRSRDMDDMDSPEDLYLESVDPNYEKMQFPSTVPNTVDAANSTMWNENGGENDGVDNINVVSLQHPKLDEKGNSFACAPGAESAVHAEQNEDNLSPLDTLAQIQNSLPQLTENAVVSD